MRYIQQILSSWHTVFTIQTIRTLSRVTNYNSLMSIIKRLVSAWVLYRRGHGIWTLTRYDEYELASKLYTPSYISLETALVHAGVIFQWQGKQIFLIANRKKEKKVWEMTYIYRRLPEKILHDMRGIEQLHHYQMASPERAMCDWIYCYNSRYVDNPFEFDHDKLHSISEIYPKRVALSITNLIDDARSRTA